MRVLALSLCLAAMVLAQAQPEHVWGRITAVNKSGFEVDQNFNADPASAYRREKRQITVTPNTKFEESAREDLRVGRTVDIIGRETKDAGVQAARVIVYEGNAPVRMAAGARVTATNGSVHFGKQILAVSIFHIGLPLDHPAIPAEERPKIAKRLSDLRERMMRAGFRYEIVYASPETGLDGFKHQLKTQPCDGVLIGGGVVGDPAMSYFMEQIVEAAHEVAPKAKIMFYNHSVDVRAIVERWFGSRSDG